VRSGLSRNIVCAVLLLLALAACEMRRTGGQAPGATKGSLAGKPALPAFTTASSEDGQWTMQAKNYASTRYSGLSAIDSTNVGGLKVAWTFSTGMEIGRASCRERV